MVQFISVPLKQTNEIDFIKPLTSYVNSLTEISADLKNEVNEAIIELNKLRNRSCIQTLDKNQSSLELLTRYYDQLCAMDSKIPICPTQNPISFKWKNAFYKKSLFFSKASLTINDSSFERASVLFNCGAFMSVVAANHQVNTDDELKTVAKLLQQSAGVFSKLKDCVLGLLQQESTSDLMPDTLSALSALMLAQAQEVFFVKVTRDHNKPIMLVKIAAQTAEFYQDAQKLMTRDIVKGIWPKEWLQIITGKSFIYSALGQYHQSVLASSKKHIGEQISRLREAQRLFEISSSYLPSTFDYKAEIFAVKKDLELAINDNNYIYYDTIPDFSTLPPLEKVAAAKVLPVVTPLTFKFQDLFENLIPVSIQNSLSLFESRKIDVINFETNCMREYTQILNASLASLNLPAALDDVKNYKKCPESIREKSLKVKSNGGIDFINSKVKDLPLLYKKNEEILNEVYRLLKEEKENDDNLRIKFQEKWTRMPSDKLTSSLIQELGKFRGVLFTASSADAIIQQKFDSNKKGIEILSKPEPDLISSIPSLCSDKIHKNSDTVQKLIELMDKVDEIKNERKILEKKFKEVKFDMSNDFLKLYTDNGVINEEKISNEKIHELFQPLKIAVQNSIKLQETVLADIQTYNKRFLEEIHVSGSDDRENVLKLLATAYDAFFSLKENILEGLKFYNDLTPILVKLQEKVSDFCFARKTEKDDLIKELQQNILNNNNLNSAKCTAPPPRPPLPTSLTYVSQPQQQLMPGIQMPTIPINQTYNTQQIHQNPAQIQQPGTYMPQTNPFVPYGMTLQSYQIPYPMQYPSTYPENLYSTVGSYNYSSSGTYSQQQPQNQYGAYPSPSQPQ